MKTCQICQDKPALWRLKHTVMGFIRHACTGCLVHRAEFHTIGKLGG